MRPARSWTSPLDDDFRNVRRAMGRRSLRMRVEHAVAACLILRPDMAESAWQSLRAKGRLMSCGVMDQLPDL
jgi:hypothetical protein